MVVVSEQKKKLFESRPLVPRVENSNIGKDQIKKLYFTTTTKTAFVPKSVSKNSSFSDVHKAAQRAPVNVKQRAPFWSREMSQYHKAFIPLPLEGAEINRELARTFQPEFDGTSTTGSSTSLQGANPTHFHTKYEEDYSSNVILGKDYRTAAFRPEVQKHIREENKLIYTDSITHEKFVDLTAGLGSQPREPLKPPIDKPTNASAGFRFKTSYTDEYTDVSALAFRPEQKRGSTNSSRIYGSAVPARIISFKSDNGIHDLLDTSLPPVRDILFGSSVNRPTIIESFPDPSNPYIADFLNQST